MSKEKRCKCCYEKNLGIKPYCSKCQKVDISCFGDYTTGLSNSEIDKYLMRRANTEAITRIRERFNKIAGVNTVGVHQCEMCGKQMSLMYRHDVERFADVLFLGKGTYFD